MVDANELARQTLAEARERRLIETAERNDNPPPPISTYAGFDCKTGEALLRPAGGGIVRGQPLYNTAVRPGDIMDLHVSQGLPKADSLSAWEPEPIEITPEPEDVYGKLKILFRMPDGSLWIGGDRRTPKRIGEWDEDRRWTLANLGTGSNRFLVTGINPDDYFTIVRYGAGSTIVTRDESSDFYDGFAVVGSLRPQTVIGNGGLILFTDQFNIDIFWNGYRAMRGLSESAVLVDSVFVTGNANSSNKNGSLWFHYYSNIRSSGLFEINSSTDDGVLSGTPTGLIGTSIGQIPMGSIRADWSITRTTETDTRVAPVFSANVFRFFLMGNSTNDAFVYPENVQVRESFSGAIISDSVKWWLHTSSGRTEVQFPSFIFDEAFEEGLTMARVDLYGTPFIPLGETVGTVSRYTLDTEGSYQKTQTLSVDIYAIPSDAIILDQKYHP